MKKTLANVKSRYLLPVVAGAGMLANTAFAQSSDPVTKLLEGIDLAGAAAKVAAVGLVVVGIYFAIKAVGVAKRVIGSI